MKKFLEQISRLNEKRNRSDFRRQHASQKLDFKIMEPRQLMAGDIGTAVGSNTFLVSATDGADHIEFVAGQTNHVIRRNGQEQVVSAEQFTEIVIVANGDDDTLRIVGDEGIYEKVRAKSSQVTVECDNYKFRATDFANTTVEGNLGDGDRVYLYGTDGDDQLYANPTNAQLTRSNSTFAESNNFDRVYIEGYDGFDVSVMEDGVGDDVFKVRQGGQTILDSSESYIKATSFEKSAAHAINGGYDKAYQDDTEEDDLLVVSDDRVRMISQTKDSEAIGFERNYSYSRHGGDDLVRMYDSVFDDEFSFDALFDETSRQNGWEARRTFVRLFSGNFYRRAEGFVISDAMIANPSKLIGEYSDNGAVGVNMDFENGSANEYYIEMQRYGSELIQVGLGISNNDMVDLGMSVLQWGVDQQSVDGVFENCGDQVHSTSLFMYAMGLAIEDLDTFSYHKFTAETRTQWVNSLDAMASWMIDHDDQSADVNLEPFTHRYFLRGAGLKRAFLLTGNTDLDLAADIYVTQGYSKMTTEGVLPERGGFDLNYQVLGLRYAGDFHRMTMDETIQGHIEEMFNASLTMIQDRIDANGDANMSDSTRADETSRDGFDKTFDYRNAVRAFFAGGDITGDDAWYDLANLIISR